MQAGCHIHKITYMDGTTASRRLSALAEPKRLQVYRQLVATAPEGQCVSQLQVRIGLSQPALSFHLKELANAGLVTRRKAGRRAFYAPSFPAMHELMSYLMENCCEGQSCLNLLRDCEPATGTQSA